MAQGVLTWPGEALMCTGVGADVYLEGSVGEIWRVLIRPTLFLRRINAPQ